MVYHFCASIIGKIKTVIFVNTSLILYSLYLPLEEWEKNGDYSSLSSGANSQISWRGKFFYGVGVSFFRHHSKSPVSAPPIDVNSCTKMYKALCMYTFIETLNQWNKQTKIGGIFGGGGAIAPNPNPPIGATEPIYIILLSFPSHV